MDVLHHGMPATGGESFGLQALTGTLLEAALNEVMDEQADMACEGGANSRNGYCERGLITPVGKITLRIPKLRCGAYFPEGMLERYSRVGKVLQAVFAQDDPAMVRAAYHAAMDVISSFSQAATGLLEDDECDALAYLAFSAEHRRRISTNNVQGRASREIKRRTRAVQVFPSVESMIRPVGAVMAECDEDWSSRHAIASMDLPEKPAAPSPRLAKRRRRGPRGWCSLPWNRAAWSGRRRSDGIVHTF